MTLFDDKKDIFELMERFDKSSICELEITAGEGRIRLSKAAAPNAAARIPQPPETHVVQEVPEVPKSPKVTKTITAPLVGTFYSSASPDSGPYVKVGDRVTKGMVVCIIEAMKNMNEIESEEEGEIAEILVKNHTPVEYGQPLFRLN